MNIKHLMACTLGAALLSTSATAESHMAQGRDGNLNIIYWQAVSGLNPFLSGGTKDIHAASLVLEPLARYDQDGNLVAWLASEIPTIENGGISEDLTTITWNITPGIKWSDGSALTAEDVVFSAAYCMDPEGGCAQEIAFSDVESVVATDELTVTVTFSKPKPFPYGPFVGMISPIIQKAQFENCTGTAAQTCTEANGHPIGTGAFVVDEFRANDVVTYVANTEYRVPSQPAFATLTFKGGGDATAAARAVLQTGEFDYAWNLQIDPTVLADMEAAGKGAVVSAFGTSVERILVNLTNPSADLGELRSTREGGPHPFLQFAEVRQALSMAVNREILVEVGYGQAGRPTCNVLAAPAIYASTANDGCLTQDIDGANALLDAAGWEIGSDGVRAKDGVRLSILYQTSTNAVRQDTQALVKQWWSEIGVEAELRNIDAGVFFGGDPASPDTYLKHFADVEMFTNNFTGTDPETYMNSWVCADIPRPETGWLGNNMPRYCSADYDALASKLSETSAIEDRATIVKQMNDMLVQYGAIIPLIHRGTVSAHANSLQGVVLNTWDSEMWNAATWTRGE